MTAAAIVSKFWSYCNVLQDDGMSDLKIVQSSGFIVQSYGKSGNGDRCGMADERRSPPYNQPSAVPDKYNWPTLLKKDGDDLFDHYRHMLESLGNEKGLLGLIFNKSQNKFQDPSKLRRLVVDLIDKENWSVMSADVKGDAYEGLLEKNAQDTESGAGQCFTPRPLIQAMVDVVQPKPKKTLCDPACGTGGFLLAAHSLSPTVRFSFH
jgi:type I restriction enzyme M protein